MSSPHPTPSSSGATARFQFDVPAQSAMLTQVDARKLPCFYGEPDRDSITPQEFINRVDMVKASQGWEDDQTYANVYTALYGKAGRWVQHLKLVHDDHTATWDYLKKQFTAQFVKQQDGSAMMEAMSSIKPLVNVNPAMADIDTLLADVMDAFIIIDNVIPQDVVPVDGLINQAQVNDLIKANRKMVIGVFQRTMYVNNLPADIRSKIKEKNPNTMAECVKMARQLQADEVQKSAGQHKKIFVIGKETGPSAEANPTDSFSSDEIASMRQFFQNKNRGGNPTRGNGSFRGRGNNSHRGNKNNSSRGNSNSSNGNNGTTTHCIFCKKNGHNQENCFRRIRENAPCYDAKGRRYFPKNLVTVSESNTDNPAANSNTAATAVMPVMPDFR